MRKHKYSLTLLEVIIALSITGLLLSFLWQAYFGAQKQLLAIQEKKAQSLQKIVFQEKVSRLISSLVIEDAENLMYTAPAKVSSSTMLVFKTTLPIDQDPAFSGPTVAALYLTEANDLCVVYWATEERARAEILFKRLDACTFLFFDAKTKEWTNSWPLKNRGLPEMIQIQITQNSQQESYFFFPTQHLGPIFYPKKISR